MAFEREHKPQIDTDKTGDLSPLDEIRQLEVEVASQLAAAREAADQRIKAAQEEAEGIKHEARENGQREGRKRYQEIISQSEGEAKEILERARRRAEEQRKRAEDESEAAVQAVIDLILEREGENNAG